MSSWLEDPRERQLLAETLHSRYRGDKEKQAKAEEYTEAERVEDTWKAACEKAKTNGELRLCWLELGHVSQQVYTFEVDHCQSLKELILDGIGLSSMESIPQHCSNLKRLSLASNNITDITGIHYLKSLTRLNLLRNSITNLPPDICGLGQLTRLDIANNKLVELPAEIGRLKKLKKLNLECNELSELPHSFGHLRSCETLVLNNNDFAVFPASILSMSSLMKLSMNNNHIGYLPSEIGNFCALQELYLSKNCINILPDSLVDIRSLRYLWLDYNNLSSLPPHFHRLTKLKKIKLEGNMDMIYPPIEKVVSGIETLMRWSRNRMELSKSSKVRNIVQSVEEVLNQVKRYKIGGPLHESVFEVVGQYYQYPPDAFWSVFIPGLSKIWTDTANVTNDGIKTFPFERHEVEQALFEFRDAAGPIVKIVSGAYFRRCSCIQSGRGAVCIPPKVGYMCTRPAMLVRAKVAYEENMREKRRLADEAKRVNDAVKAAKNVAKAYLDSEDGMMMVRDEAEKRIAIEVAERGGKPSVGARKGLRDVSLRSVNEISGAILSNIGSSVKSTATKIKSQLRGEKKMMLIRLENQIKHEYIDEKVAECAQQVLVNNQKIRWIVSSWIGLSSEDCFRKWRRCVEKTKQSKRREQRAQLKQFRLNYEESRAKYEQEKIDYKNWMEDWDEFNDVYVWVHAVSGEQRWDKPEVPKEPLIPKHIIDEKTGEVLSPRTIKRNEADSSDSEYTIGSESFVSDTYKDEDDETARAASFPKGRDEEFELAAKRVLEIRRHQLLSKTN